MKIRKARPADGEKISDLLNQLGYPGTGCFIVDKIVELASYPDAELVVAEEGDSVVGVMSIHFIPQLALAGAFARISYFCVDESCRGRGTGRELEEYCEREAVKRGCDRVEVHCNKSREQAIEFYHRHGYRESPEYLVKTLDKS